jgi:hypothetical protein
VFRRSGRGDPPRRGTSPDAVYRDLRSMALEAVERGALAPPFADHPDVAGVIVDVPATGGSATIVALADDTTSLYTSTGGGTIGAGEHATVATATRRC